MFPLPRSVILWDASCVADSVGSVLLRKTKQVKLAMAGMKKEEVGKCYEFVTQ